MEKSGRSKSTKAGTDARSAKVPSAAKRKSAEKAAAKKKGSKKKPMDAKLTLKKFKTRKPEKLFRPQPDKAYQKNFVAPPFARDKEAAGRIRQILFRKYEFSETSGAVSSSPPVPSKGAAEKPGRPAGPPETNLVGRQPHPWWTAAALAGGLIFLMALVIAASASNHGNYHLKTTNGAVEVWRGRFAPIGQNRILVLPGAQPPGAAKAVYSENEIKTFAFNYYIDRVDVLLEASEIPDFEGIKVYLQKALFYGVTPEQRRAALNRLNTIDMMIYLYKADVAASKGARTDYQAALVFLKKAAALNIDAAQSELVNKKIKSIEELMATPRERDAGRPESPAAVPGAR